MDTYDFASKHLYRQRRESAIDRLASGNAFTRRVAYLDTGEALDTMTYLRRGYQPNNLWAINHNPSEVAHLTMTLKAAGLPTVNTVGLDFEDALDRRVPEVDVIDFDGTSCLNPKLRDMFGRITDKRTTGVFCVTILAGREAKNTFTAPLFSDRNNPYLCPCCGEITTSKDSTTRTSFNQEVSETHYTRIRSVRKFLTAKDIRISKAYWDVYTSASGQAMCWTAVKLVQCNTVRRRA